MGINRYEGTNYGSLILIEYVAAQNITSFNRSTKSSISSAGIVLAAGAAWQSIYCSEDTMQHRQELMNDNNGECWQHSVSGFTPGDQPAIEAGLQALAKNRYVVRITRPDGTKKIVGTKTAPLDFKLDSDTQSTVPGPAGTKIIFGALTPNRALICI